MSSAGLAHAQPVPIAPQFGTTSPTQDPQKLQLPLRAPITLLPSITVSEEYNDNVLLDNHNRHWDLITGITPAINLIWESRTHRLLAGYNFTAELYLRDPGRDNAFNHQNFTLDGMWRATERLTLTLTDGFTATTDTNLIPPEGVSVGRSRSFGNVLAGGRPGRRHRQHIRLRPHRSADAHARPHAVVRPRYSWVKSPDIDRNRNGRIDIQSFTMPLQVTYCLTAWMAAVARYQFFRQRTPSELRDNAGDLIATDADQNRLFVGLQFGYPITFDRP